MSFEDYLRQNREHLYDQKAGPEMWDRIERDLGDNPASPFSQKMKSTIVLISTVLVLGLVCYIFYAMNEQRKALEETQKEMFAMRSLMEDQLNDDSSFRRIKAVNMSAHHIQADPEITNVLINTMLKDENETVRMASINALENHADMLSVKEAMIQALEVSESPFIQVKIINILANINDKSILPLLDQIIDDQGSHGYVKEEALAARSNIKSL